MAEPLSEQASMSPSAPVPVDPFAWGIVLADLARHIALSQQIQHSETGTDAFVERLLEGFHAEIENPTDEPEGEVTQ